MYGPSLQKEILATMASSSPKNNREFAAQSRPEGPKRSHSPQPELKSAEAQASERPRAKKKSGKSNWGQRKKSGKKGKSNWASFNSQRKICHGKQNETKIPRQNLLKTQFIRSLLAVWCNEQFGRRARCHQKHKVFKQNPIFSFLQI